MLKKLLIVLAVLLAIVGIAAYYVLTNLDTIVKNIIEESGSRVLQTDVTVEAVNIDLSEGRATISHLAVANPPGYSSQPAFRFSEVTAVINLKSGQINRIYTSEPEVRVEFKGDESNFLVLQRNIEESAYPEEEEADEEKQAEDEEEEVVTLKVDEVVIEGAKATVTSDMSGQPVELYIERLRFENLEGTPDHVARTALRQFIAQVLAAVARAMIEEKANEIIEKHGEELKDKLKSLLN